MELNNEELIRFMSKVDSFEPGQCWNWAAAKYKGYGYFWLYGKNIRAHRLSFYIANNVMPSESFVCHGCDNQSCVNPEHLFLGDASINAKDMSSKNRVINQYMGKTHCKHGHEFSKENTRIDKNNFRHCRSCSVIRGRSYLKRKKNEINTP